MPTKKTTQSEAPKGTTDEFASMQLQALLKIQDIQDKILAELIYLNGRREK